MISSRQELNEFLTYEYQKYFQNLSQWKYRALLCAHDERAVIWHYQKCLRKTEYHYNTKHRLRYLLSRIKLNKLTVKYGMNIGINSCDKGLKIMHIGPILFNGNVKVGKNCSVHINTAIVARGTTDEVPVLGDDIVIGVGATILGGIQLADGIAVGAGSVVNKSFDEPEIAIAGVPARKISDNGRSKWANRKKSE